MGKPKSVRAEETTGNVYLIHIFVVHLKILLCFVFFYLREIGVFTLAIHPAVNLGFAVSCTSTSPILMRMVTFLKLPDVGSLISAGTKYAASAKRTVPNLQISCQTKQ